MEESNQMKKKLLVTILVFICPFVYSQDITVQTAGTLNKARCEHQSQLLTDGRVLVFGGHDGHVNPRTHYRSSEIYDPASNTWTFSGEMKEAHVDMASVVLNDGRVLAIAGEDEAGNVIRTCEMFDPQTESWTYATPTTYPRTHHRAIKLNNGKVLLAGTGDLPCELFDPATNSWSLTGTTIQDHGWSFALTLLENGNVLLSGGDPASTSAEIYIPAMGKWYAVSAPMNGKRRFHSTVLLGNGRVLIYGSGVQPDENTAEWYDNTGFSSTGKLNELRSSSPGILLDNGCVLAYGLGDFNTPANTKVLEIFNPLTGAWTTKAYDFIGGQAYTINRLNNGTILIAGGTSTGGTNGANANCLLIRPVETGSCAMPSVTLDVTVSQPSICKGKDAVISISNSETGVSYQCYIAGVKAGYAVNGGGNIQLTIPSDQVALGKNSILVRAGRSNCNAVVLNKQVTITVTQDNMIKPAITADGPLTFCEDTGLKLTCTTTAAAYLWNNNATNPELNILASGSYYVYTRDANNCMSLPSDTLTCIKLPSASTVSAGNDKLICANQGIVQLQGIPEKGGTWSGQGVNANGAFDPASIPPGKYPVVYTYCNKNDTAMIEVNSGPTIKDFNIDIQKQYYCKNSPVVIMLLNTQADGKYELFQNNKSEGIREGLGGWTIYPKDEKVVITVIGFVTGPCSQSKYRVDTLYQVPNPVISLKSTADTVCPNQFPIVKVYDSELNTKYDVYAQSVKLSDAVEGNGSTISIPLNTSYYGQIAIYATTEYGCRYPLIQAPVTAERKLTVDFISSITEALVGDTVLFENISNADNYTWNIESQTSSGKTPGPVVFNSPGIKQIMLIGTTLTPACSDTAIRSIEIFPSAAVSPGTACKLDSLDQSVLYTNQVYALHVDRNGNSYVSSNYYYPNNSRQMTASLKKFDKNGKLLWDKKTDYMPEATSSFIVDIESDKDGNIYVAGNAGGKTTAWGDWIIYHHTKKMITAFLIKLNPNGDLEWVISADNFDTSPKGFTDIVYINDNAIYASLFCTGGGSVEFPGKPAQKFDGEVTVLQIDKYGNLIHGYSSEYQDPFQNKFLYSGINPGGAGYDDVKLCLSPKIAVTTTGNVLVSGKSNQMIKFGNLTYPSPAPGVTNFVAVLDMQKGWQHAFRTYAIPCLYEVDWWDFRHPFWPVQLIGVDKNDDIYLVDYWDHTISTNPVADTLTVFIGSEKLKDQQATVLTKFDLSGKLKWYNKNKCMLTKSMAVLKNEVVLFGSYKNSYASYMQGKWIGVNGVKDKYSSLLASYAFDGSMKWMERVRSNGVLGLDVSFFMMKDKCDDNLYFGGYSQGPSRFKDRSLGMNTEFSFISKYSANNSCLSTLCPDIITDVPLHTITDRTLSVYPNPTNGVITLNTQDDAIESVTVTDQLGNMVFYKHIDPAAVEVTIDLSHLSNAVYTINAVAKGKEHHAKFILLK